MHFNPDPFVMTSFARQRHEAFQAEANHNRLARLAQGSGAQQRRWSVRAPVVAVAVALTLLVAGAVTAQQPSSQPLAAISDAADSVTRFVLAPDSPETSAVQKVREATQAETAATEPTADADLAKATPKLILGKITFTDILVS
jgi:hypothetical protein